MSLVLWTLTLSLILLALRAIVAPLTPRRLAKWAFFPGLLVAVGARSIACGLAAAPLKAVNLPWREGEPVVHDKPEVPVLGWLALALFPLAAAAAAILLARWLLAPPLTLDVRLPEMVPDAGALAVLLDTSAKIVRGAAIAAMNGPLLDWRVAAFLYVAASVLLFCAPTYEEWKWVAGGVGAMALGVSLFSYLGVTAGFLTRGWFIGWLYGDPVFEALALFLTAALVTLVLAAALRGAFAFTRAAFGSKADKRR